MQAATRGIFYVLAFILFIYGVIDVIEQLQAGDEIKWRVPIVFLGFGAGIPLILFSFPGIFSMESDVFADGESGDCGADGSND